MIAEYVGHAQPFHITHTHTHTHTHSVKIIYHLWDILQLSYNIQDTVLLIGDQSSIHV